MEVQLSIQGMSCLHCSGRVEKFLASQPNLTEIRVDLEAKSASFTCPGDQEIDPIIQGIIDLGYKTAKQ